MLALFYALIVFVTSAVGAVLLGFGVNATGAVIFLFFVGGVLVQYGLARVRGETVTAGRRPGSA